MFKRKLPSSKDVKQKKRKVTPKIKVFAGRGDLMKDGFCVVPFITEHKKYKELFDAAISSMPEFKPSAKTYVLGGFKALGNPGSFHNWFVRHMRWRAHLEMYQTVWNKHVTEDLRLEQIMDRMLLRPTGATVSSESWHRDICIKQEKGDKVFGGWVNLNIKETQYFCCVPQSHTEVKEDDQKGFYKLNDTSYYRSRAIKVAIPPGHLIIFFEDIIHMVYGGKAKYDIYRLFIGWRLTRSSTPLFDLKLEEQGVPLIKSGQRPPLYARLHWTNWRSKIVEFSKHLHENCLEDRKVLSGPHKGQSFRVCKQFLPSLKELGLPLYDSYDEIEKAILMPQPKSFFK